MADATTRDIGPQFFDSQGNAMMIDDHIFEVGEQITIKNNVFNDHIDSKQTGTLELLIQDYRLGQTVETIKRFDFEMTHKTSKMFEWDHTFTKIGLFSFESDVSSTSPYGISEGFGKDFSVVDKHSKAYAENNGCADDLEIVLKPNFSTVVCVTESTQDDLIDRGWHAHAK